MLVLTSMNQHGSLSLAAVEAGKHVLVEKPMATSLEAAAELVEAARKAATVLVCAPHIMLLPAYYREIHRCVVAGEIGTLHLARARYGRTVRTVRWTRATVYRAIQNLLGHYWDVSSNR